MGSHRDGFGSLAAGELVRCCSLRDTSTDGRRRSSSQFDEERATILNVANFVVELLFEGNGEQFFYGGMPFAAGQFLLVLIGSWPARNADVGEDPMLVGGKWCATAKVRGCGRTRVLSVGHRRGVCRQSRRSTAWTHGDSFYARAGADDAVVARPPPYTVEARR
jgi:hypothetical protein